MILIADSGSTKTDWVIISETETISFQTIGLSPYFVESNDIHAIITSAFPSNRDTNSITQLFFYGTGCKAESSKKTMQRSLKNTFKRAHIIVDPDLVGAARALLVHKPGIIAILGTGMNIGYWNGKTIEYTSPSLGYILGDEGSGAYMGKALLQAYFYDLLPTEISEKFSIKYKLSRDEFIAAIYKGSSPNKYLASFSSFIKENRSDSYIYNLAKSAFEEFIEKHVLKIAEKTQIFSIFVVGSIGYHFADILKSTCEVNNIGLERVEQSPIHALCDYHSNL